MKLGKSFGRIGFVVGFLGPLLFYASPATFPTYQSNLLCPWCPYIDIAFATRLTWIGLGLQVGLVSGLLLSAIGFGFGYVFSKLDSRIRTAPEQSNG